MCGKQNYKCWSSYLPLFSMAYNSHLNESIGMSSYKALTGRQMSLPIELITSDQPPFSTNLPISEIINKIINEIFTAKKKSLQVRQKRYKYVDILKTNKLVWLYIAPQTRLSITWQGPYLISAKIGSTCYTVSPVLIKGRSLLVHESRLRPCHADMSLLKTHIGNSLLSQDVINDLTAEVDLTTSFSDPLHTQEENDFDILEETFIEPFQPQQTPAIVDNSFTNLNNDLSHENLLTNVTSNNDGNFFKDDLEDELLDALVNPENIQDEFIQKLENKQTFIPQDEIKQNDKLISDVILKRKPILFKPAKNILISSKKIKILEMIDNYFNKDLPV